MDVHMNVARPGGRGAGDGGVEVVDPFGEVGDTSVRCVWSDALDGCACRAEILRAIVEAAWQGELAAGGDREGRFFHLIHDGGVWQAYGLETGLVRGVYCPSHNSQRAERSRAAACDAGDVVYELALAA
jgi:hypothetical protein